MKKIIAIVLSVVMLLMVGVPVVSADDTAYVRTAFEPFNGITLDGSITEAEWGEPVIVTDPAHCQSTWGAFYVTEAAYRNFDQKAKVYMTNDKSYIYIGCTLDESDFDTSCTVATMGELMKSAHLSFTLAKYDPVTTVENFVLAADGKTYERYAKFTLGWVSGTPTCVSSTQGRANTNLAASDYSLMYDAATRTYTYEVRVPISSTPLTPTTATDVAVSVNIGCTKHTTASSFSNRYNITTGAANCGGGGNLAHKDKAMRMTMNSVWTLSPYVRTAFEPFNGITLDGSITEAEWGEPVIVTDPAHCQSTWGAFYVTEATYRNYSQEAKVYMTNDKSYIYIGCTLDESEFDTSCTAATMGELMKSAHLSFTLAKYDPATTVENFVLASDGKTYERYAKFTLGWANGTPTCVSSTQGRANTNLEASDYSIKYNPATRTYTYEVRVPITSTPLTPTTATDIAVSVNIGCTKYTTASSFSNRYNITTGAANCGGGGNLAHKGKAMRMTINDVWEDVGTYVRDRVEPYNGVTIDGTITEAEWGEPVIVTTQEHCASNWAFYVTEATYKNPYQTAKVYMTNDNDYIYIGCTLDESDLDASCTEATLAALLKCAHLSFTLAQYDEDTTVPHTIFSGEAHEVYARFTLGLLNGVTPACASNSQGRANTNLEASDYSVRYTPATRTYSYEVRVPFSKTNIDSTSDTDIVMSMNIGCTKHTTASAFSNRYNLTTAASSCGGPGNFAHQNNALKITLNDDDRLVDTYVRDRVAPYNGVTLDGSITKAEWGEPVAVMTAGKSQELWAGYFIYEVDQKDLAQTVKVYMTNDTQYIYLGCTVDRCDLDSSCTQATTAALMSAAHLSFSLATYNEATTVPHIIYLEEEYEQYSKFTLGLLDGITPACTSNSQGRSNTNLDPSDYSIRYDPAARTYIYEVRVPLKSTNIDIYDNLDIAMSLNVGSTKYTAASESSNRINLTVCANNCGRAYNFAHNGKALKLTLNDDPDRVQTYVRDTVAPFKGVCIDGYVSQEEWGEPIIVTMPGHCQKTWGAFWKHDAASVEPSQVARVYATNDSKYVYFAATLDKSDFDNACTQASRLYNYAHFRLTLSAYNKETTYSHVRSLKNDWEQYACYMLGFVDGKPAIYNVSQKIDVCELKDSDWAVRYDEASRTYFYEIRIPYEYTTLCFGNDNMMATSMSIGCAYVAGNAANRYNLTTGQAKCSGANNFAHTGDALVLQIYSNPYTKDINVALVCGVGMAAALTGGICLLLRRRAVRRASGIKNTL